VEFKNGPHAAESPATLPNAQDIYLNSSGAAYRATEPPTYSSPAPGYEPVEGWFEGTGGTGNECSTMQDNAFNFTTLIATDITLCKKYTAPDHTITITPGEGIATATSTQLSYSAASLAGFAELTATVEPGYHFAGWSITGTGITIANQAALSTTISVNQTQLANLTDVTITANAAKDHYSITFEPGVDKDGETMNTTEFPEGISSIEFGSDLTSITTPTAHGYSFASWKRKDTGVDFIDTTMPALPGGDGDTLTLVAQWTVNSQDPLTLEFLTQTTPSTIQVHVAGGSGTGAYLLTSTTPDVCAVTESNPEVEDLTVGTDVDVNLLSSGTCTLTLDKAGDDDFVEAHAEQTTLIGTLKLKTNPQVAQTQKSYPDEFFKVGTTVTLPTPTPEDPIEWKFNKWCDTANNCYTSEVVISAEDEELTPTWTHFGNYPELGQLIEDAQNYIEQVEQGKKHPVNSTTHEIDTEAVTLIERLDELPDNLSSWLRTKRTELVATLEQYREQISTQEHEDNEDGISIEGDLPIYVTIEHEVLDKLLETKILQELGILPENLVVAYKIDLVYLINHGDKQAGDVYDIPEGKTISVTLHNLKLEDALNYSLYHKHLEQTPEKLNFTKTKTADGYNITFTVNKFSEFLLVKDTASPEPIPQPSAPDSPTHPTAADATAPALTGVDVHLLLGILLGLVLTAAVLKRRWL
jgi:hypothetical protein